jgi:hypothetical protein
MSKPKIPMTITIGFWILELGFGIYLGFRN